MPKSIFGKYAPKLIFIGTMLCVTSPSFAADGWNLYGDQPSYFVHYGDGEDLTYALANQSMLGLKVEVNGIRSTIGIDTGSTGMVLGQAYWARGFTPVGPPGWVYYNSSGLVVTGVFQTMQVSILGSGNGQQVTSLVPVLFATGYQCLSGAPNYCASGQTGRNSPVYGISMLGVGFDRTTMGEGVLPSEPDNEAMKKYVDGLQPTSQAYNPFLNLSEMQSGTMRRGYIITPTGVYLGLNQQNTSSEAFTYGQLLLQSAGTNGVPNQWQQVQGTITVGGVTSPTTLLMDTGITNAFINVPNGNAAAVNNTAVTISLAGGSASYTFLSGDLANPQTPYPLDTSNSGSFVNSSLHTYAGFDVLFDADGGFIGIAANGYSPNTNVTVVPLIAAQGPLNLTQDFETTLPLFLVGPSTVNTAATAIFDGMIFGSNSLTLNGGTIILNGAVTNTGGVTVGTGTTTLNGTLTGSLTVNPGASFFNAGAVTGSIVNFGQMGNTGTILGNVSTAGSLSNSGLIEGAVVNAFVFSNDGTVLGPVTTSGTLSGNGTVSSVLVERGGSVSPGHSIGTVTVTGDATFEPGSLYVAELGSSGTSDRLNVGGTLTAGGATLYLVPGSGFVPALGATYQVYTAGSVASNFTVDNTLFSTAASVYPFLAADLGGTGTLTLSRSTVSYTAFTQTANEWAAASAADTLGNNSTLNQSLALLNGSEAPAVFASLSGQAYASVQTGLQQQSVYLRDAATARVRQAFAKGGEPAAAAASAKTAELVPGLALTAWAQAYGGWGQTEGDSNAASLSRSIGGFLMGIDSPLGGAWRFGLLGGYSQSTFNVDGVNSSADSDNYDLGLYGGARFGDLGLRFGAGYTWHDLTMNRTLALAGVTEALSSNYQAGTAQVFGEAGYGFHFGATTAEPFADLAYVSLKTDGFTESGGAAALSGDSETFGTTYSVLGLRLGHPIPVATGGDLMLTGSLGWQHAYGGLTPTQTAFFAGSSSFTTSGVPIARDTALIDVGFGYNPTPNIDVGLHYDGAFASSAQDSAIKGTLKIRF